MNSNEKTLISKSPDLEDPFEQKFLENIKEEIAHFQSISLSDASRISLMKRKEIKFLLSKEQLFKVFPLIVNDYNILEIDDNRIFKYSSRYYDTENLCLFKKHHNGRVNRFKIRHRTYLDTGNSFFEIKKKDNRGNTIKSRIPSIHSNTQSLIGKEVEFLELKTPYLEKELKPSLSVNYKRITLVNKHIPERITIDLNLSFEENKRIKGFPEIAIIEIKQEKIQQSEMIKTLKNEHLRSGTLSKYCLGIITMNPHVKHNAFKPKLRKIKKLITQNSFSKCC